MTKQVPHNIPDRRIDRGSPVPYYYQLYEILRDAIEEGYWPPGSQLMTEAEMCELYGVSRTTVRQTLAQLLSEGLVRKERGRGTFVAEPKIHERLVERLTGFYDDMVAQGFEPQTRVLSSGVVPASKTVGSALGIARGTPVIRITRLRMIEQEPILLVDTYIPYALCPNLLEEDLENQSLYGVLARKYGLRPARGRRFIEAVAATEKDAQLLNIPRGAPLIYLKSMTYVADGRPMEYFEAKHRGDRARFEVEIVHANSVPGGAVDLPPAWGIQKTPRH